MTYTITRNTSAACQPPAPPINPDTGETFPMMVEYSSGWLHCWFQDVDEGVAAVIGDPSYLTETDPQAKLISRIRAALRIATVRQAEIIHEAQCDGRFDRCTDEEKSMLFAPRFTQPAGLYQDLFNEPFWLSQVALVVVGTGYNDEKPVPKGANVLVVDPRSNEELLESLAEVGAIRLFMRDIDE